MIRSCVIDVSHYRAPGNLTSSRLDPEVKVLGVIAKATEGVGFRDWSFEDWRAQAARLGIDFASFHFGTGDDVQGQLDVYFSKIGLKACLPSGPKPRMVLDWEFRKNGPSMTVDQAEKFVSACFDATGKWPILYTGRYGLEKLAGKPSETLARCPLWYASYTSQAALVWPTETWPTITLWQYTGDNEGIAGPRSVQGIGTCDISHYLASDDPADLHALLAG